MIPTEAKDMFTYLMKEIDQQSFQKQDVSFLRVSSQDYDYIKNNQKDKEQIKPQYKYNEEEKQQQTNRPQEQEMYKEDLEELVNSFMNFDREVIEDILRSVKDVYAAFDILIRLESEKVNEQENETMEQLEDYDSDEQMDEAQLQQKFEDIERDRRFAERLEMEAEEEEINAEVSNEEMAKALGIQEGDLTDMIIQEKLRKYLFDYRYEEKIKKNQKNKSLNPNQCQMKKIKKLNASEQHVFQNFLDMLEVQCFDLLSLKNQMKHFNNPEQQKYQSKFPELSLGKTLKSEQQWEDKDQQKQIQINNEKEFPDLIDKKVIKQVNDQRLRDRKMNLHNEANSQHFKNFEAKTIEQLESLCQIQKDFISLNHTLIQDTFNRLNDVQLTYTLLLMAFPKLHSKKDSSQIDKIMANLKKFSNNANGIQQNAHQQQIQGQRVHNEQSFFTANLLKRFQFSNYQRQGQKEVQQLYVQTRERTRQVYEKRNHFLKEMQKAKKSGNHQQYAYAKQEAERYKTEYENTQHYGQMELFCLKNNKFELKDEFMDLHGFQVSEAVNILSLRLNQIQVDLDNGSIQPNVDAKNHILKVVCGAGWHSKHKPVLKYKIPKFLKERQYQIYNFEQNGVVLVRFMKR